MGVTLWTLSHGKQCTPLHVINDQSLKCPGTRPLKSTNWVSGLSVVRGGVVSCFHAGDSFVEVRGGLMAHSLRHVVFAAFPDIFANFSKIGESGPSINCLSYLVCYFCALVLSKGVGEDLPFLHHTQDMGASHLDDFRI